MSLYRRVLRWLNPERKPEHQRWVNAFNRDPREPYRGGPKPSRLDLPPMSDETRWWVLGAAAQSMHADRMAED